MAGPGKITIALLPAVAAFLVTFATQDVETNRAAWLLLVAALLVFGGAVAASGVTARVLKRRPNRSGLHIGVLFGVIVVAYVSTFYLTGKLLTILGVLH